MRWTAVVPVKPLPVAKSRLLARSPHDREQLALAFAQDTVDAARRTAGIADVVVVTSDRAVALALEGAEVLVVGEPEPAGLNAALVRGADVVWAGDSTHGVVALCADLPALRPADLAEALRLAEAYDRSFVADADGAGTTCLIVVPGQVLNPCFGIASAARHLASGAVPLEGAFSSLRRDVDSWEDLDAARALGVGAWTAAALEVG